MPADHAKVKELFLAILEMPAAERAAFLSTACAGDTGLRQQLESMLQSQENSGELLPRPPAELLADSGATDADATAALALQPHGSQTSIEGGSPDGAESLSFLEPSDKPGHLGRLGHYEIMQVIGKGGFGIVLKGFDERLHRVVAIKVLSPAYAANGSARKRFIREAQTAAAVKNEHVVGIYDVEKDAQPPYLAMEMIDGISLQDKIDKYGPFGVKEILRIGLQMAEGLTAAHKQGLVHRDIKPANILLENGVERVKITDFGLARAVDDASVTQSGTVAGTPMYMSPEQAEGLPIDHRSDLFSLGTVLYAMCTGHSPFRGSGTHAVLKRVIDASPRPIREINNEIPDWLEAIIAKLHAKKPEDRFQTAKEVAELLGQRLADLQTGRAEPRERPVDVPITVASTPVAHAPGSPKRQRRWTVALPILAGLFVIAVGLAMHYWPHDDGTVDPSKDKLAFVPVRGGPGWRPIWDGKNFADWKRIGNVNVGRDEFTLFPGGSADTLDKMPRNFHLRMDVKLDRGQGTVRFHAQPRVENQPLPKDGWFLNFTRNGEEMVDAQLWHVNAANPDVVTPANAVSSAKCGAWFYLEVVAKDETTEVLVNGHKYMTLEHGKWLGKAITPTAGVISLWNNGREGQIAFRNIEIKELPASPPTPVAESGWVQLFNRKDLTGWKALPGQPADWKIENRELVGRSLPDSWLFSEAGHYENFTLRAEVKLNRVGNSGVFMRVPFEKFPIDSPPGYEADLTFVEGSPGSPIGSLWKGAKRIKKAAESTAAADQWFTVEISAVGPRLEVSVNGATVAVYTDANPEHRKGHIALQAFEDGTVVRFRKIEIKELPPDSPPPAVAPFDAAKAKEHQDAWATHLGVKVEIENSIGMKLRLIPPGEFMMGSTPEEIPAAIKDGVDSGLRKDFMTRLENSSRPRHKVRLSQPFRIGTCEVTVEEFRAFVKETGHRTANELRGNGPNWQAPGWNLSDKQPVTHLSWDDARAFCRWLSRRDGLVYELPTEAQWELACRAGSQGRWTFGDDPALLGDYAWYSMSEGSGPEVVGQKRANAFGLYDMHGNAQEWCLDWHLDHFYGESPFLDPLCSDKEKADSVAHVLRGGWWRRGAHLERSAARSYGMGDTFLQQGFRVAIVGDLKAKTPPPVPQFVIAGTPRLLKTIDNKSTVRALAFTAEGDTLIAGGDHLTFFDRAKGDVLHQEKLPSQITCPFSLSQDRKTLALVYKEAALVLDLPIGKIPLQAKRGLTFSAALSPDGKTLVYADEKMLRFHDRATGKTEAEGRHGSLMGLKYSPDGRFLIGINAKELLILDAKTRDLVAKKDIATPGPGGGVEISQDSKRFVTTGVSGGKFAFYVFTLPAHELQYLETNLSKAPFSLALSPDGNYLAIGLFTGKSGTVQIWDLAQKKAVASWTVAKALPSAVAFSPDGKTLATGSGNFIEVWDLTSQEPVWGPLFNAKDLTGWKNSKGTWKIQERAIVAAGAADIETERKITGNFRLRLQAKLKRGVALIRLQSPDHKRGWTLRLDGIAETRSVDSALTYEPNKGTSVSFGLGLAKLDEWFPLEILATDKMVEVLVNGKGGPKYTLNSGFAPLDGHIGFALLAPGDEAAFRDIEIKELPPSASATKAVRPRPVPTAEIAPKHRESIAKGLAYLAKTQHADGHWEASGGQFPTAVTALAGMAMLMEGSTLHEGKHADALTRAVDWLMNQCQADGLLTDPKKPVESGHYMFAHGYAMLFLATVYGQEEDGDRRRKLEKILTKAVEFSGAAQSTRGGWGYLTAAEGADVDESASTIAQLQALRAARNAGIVVPRKLIDADYLRKCTTPKGGVMYSITFKDRSERPPLTAAALAAGEYDSDLAKKWLKYCQATCFLVTEQDPNGYYEYNHYYFAQALYILGEKGYEKLFPDSKPAEQLTWSTYRAKMFDAIVARQKVDGSWKTGPVGEVYSTACWLTVLQLDNAAVPIYQR